MNDEEIFKEVLKSTELRDYFNLSNEDLKNISFSSESEHIVIEIIKSIIHGESNKSDKNATFRFIQNQIMQL